APLPLTAWYFAEISVVGPLVNLVAIPFFNLCLVPLAVLATIVLSFDTLANVAAPLVNGAAELAGATVRVLQAVAELPAAGAPLAMPPWPAFVAAAFGVAFAVGGRALPNHRLAWLALLPLAVPAVDLPPHGTAR